jgi:hypothetical protein
VTDANRKSGSAFPVVERVGGSIAGVSAHLDCTDPGLTKRELFAAMLMQASLVGNCLVNKESGSPGDLANDAVVQADALLAELDRSSLPPEKR